VLGDPAALAHRIVRGEECAGDPRHQGLEAGVEAVLFGVQCPMPRHDPADIAGTVVAQQPGRRPPAAEQGFDPAHPSDQRRLRGLGKPGQKTADLLARPGVERGEGCATRRGQRQQRLAPVGRSGHAREQPVALEALQDAAEIAGIELQRAAKLGGGRVVALREFEQHAGFGKREAAVQQSLLQRADRAGIEAAEAADGADPPLECSDVCHRLNHMTN
jgi:hypothetical protein